MDMFTKTLLNTQDYLREDMPYKNSQTYFLCFSVPIRFIYTVGHITSSNIDGFSKFFHWHIQQEICNKNIVQESTARELCKYLTLSNINVRMYCINACFSITYILTLIFHEVK